MNPMGRLVRIEETGQTGVVRFIAPAEQHQERGALNICVRLTTGHLVPLVVPPPGVGPAGLRLGPVTFLDDA